MKAKLGDIFTISSGGTPSKRCKDFYDGGNIRWVKTGDLKQKYLYECQDYITEAGLNNSFAKIYNPDTVLVAMYGATIGATSILKVDACTNQACAAFPKNEKVLPEYLYYFFRSQQRRFVKDGVGGAQPNISAGYLKDIELEILPLDEQKNISHTLEKIDSAILNKKLQQKYLDDLVKARFIEMFGNPVSNPLRWEKCCLKDCLEGIDNGKSFICGNKQRTGTAPAILKLSAVTYGIYKPNENKAIIDWNDFVESAEVHNDDLLFTRKNTPELVGMSAYVSVTPEKLMMPDLIFRLNTKKNCHKIFLWQLINHDLFRGQIQNLASGSAKSMSNISKEKLGGLEIILPPLELQKRFAAFVTQTDKLKNTIQKSLDETQLLFDSLMQEYFG